MHGKKLLQPRVLVPSLLAIALLAFIFSLSNVFTVFDMILRIPTATLGLIAVLVFAYLLLKGFELYLMLDRLNIHPGLKALVLSFIVGELNITLPFGIFAENYVMQRLQVAGFARSAAATTGILAVEAFVVLLVLFGVGVPHWDWLRPLIAAIFLLGGALMLLLLTNRWLLSRIVHWKAQGRWQKLVNGITQLVRGLAHLFELRVMLIACLLTCGYLLALSAGFMVVARAMHMPEVTFVPAMSIYFFSLAVVLLAGGIAPHIGTMEITGISAAEAWGLTATQGLAVMLGLRLIWTAMTWVIGSVVIWLLRDEWQRMNETPPA